MTKLNFRQIDYSRDLPQVIDLLAKNLDSKITEEFFRWKHYDNPIGKSYGLLALDKENIVALRMFMFWKFYNPVNQQFVCAIRPVDTVTDVKYRGKGLFKKLTLQGLEECKNEYDFIFNTPNVNSRPGYFKMGWSVLENIDFFKIGIVNLFKETMEYEEANVNSGKFLAPKIPHEIFTTTKSSDFLSWRYKDPEYKVADFEEEGNYIIYKRISIKGLPFIMIFEMLGDSSYFSRMIRALCRKNKTPLVYYYKSKEFDSIRFIKTFNRVKPVVVLKEANSEAHKDINFSLGDLESKL